MKKFVCTRFGEVCCSCSLTVLPGPAWVVLNYVLQRNFFTSVFWSGGENGRLDWPFSRWQRSRRDKRGSFFWFCRWMRFSWLMLLTFSLFVPMRMVAPTPLLLSTCSRSSDRVKRDATVVTGSFSWTEANWTISIAMIGCCYLGLSAVKPHPLRASEKYPTV